MAHNELNGALITYVVIPSFDRCINYIHPLRDTHTVKPLFAQCVECQETKVGQMLPVTLDIWY